MAVFYSIQFIILLCLLNLIHFLNMKSGNNKGRGNLIKEKEPRSRIWMGTIWKEDDKNLLKGLTYQYLIISDNDHTEEEQLHWHCLIQFKEARKHPRTSTAHWEIPRSKIEARQYCLEKGPNFFENGHLNIADQNKEEWKAFVELCKTATPKELIDSPFSKTYAQYMNFAGTVHNQFADLKIMDGDLQNEWYWGEAGSGKTKKAWQDYPDLYVKGINKWWDGYHGQDVVLLDDWDPSHEVLRSHLKIWADRYPFRAECKGSSLMARPKKIIVTSNYSIDECFQNPEDRLAIKRRFKSTHFVKMNGQ
nr:MAG: rep protein [Cressdnaviricota sp.]